MDHTHFDFITIQIDTTVSSDKGNCDVISCGEYPSLNNFLTRSKCGFIEFPPSKTYLSKSLTDINFMFPSPVGLDNIFITCV